MKGCLALGCVGALLGLAVLGVGSGCLCGVLKKKKKKAFRWKQGYLTNFPVHFWQAGGKDGTTPGAGGCEAGRACSLCGTSKP